MAFLFGRIKQPSAKRIYEAAFSVHNEGQKEYARASNELIEAAKKMPEKLEPEQLLKAIKMSAESSVRAKMRERLLKVAHDLAVETACANIGVRKPEKIAAIKEVLPRFDKPEGAEEGSRKAKSEEEVLEEMDALHEEIVEKLGVNDKKAIKFKLAYLSLGQSTAVAIYKQVNFPPNLALFERDAVRKK